MPDREGAEMEGGAAEVNTEPSPDGLVIRPADMGDLAALARIEAASYSNPWHPSAFRPLLERERVRVLVAEDGSGEVVGQAVFWWVLDEAELANLAVDPAIRQRGIGASLLDRVLAELRERKVASVFLEVRWSNEAAHHLYLTRGFTQVAVRKGYYRNPPEDARVLVRLL